MTADHSKCASRDLDCRSRPQHFKRNGEPHNWGRWKWHWGKEGDYRRKCSRCGVKEYVTVEARTE